jgi:hypothetical protein
MNDEELTARARQLAKDGIRSAEAQALAQELLRQLADRLDGHAEIDRQEAIAASWHQRQAEGRSDLESCAACPDHRPVLDSDLGWYCAGCGRCPPCDGDLPGEEESPCDAHCGYVSSGQDLLEHMLWEHRPCTECGAVPIGVSSVTHEPGCPRLRPGYVYPPFEAG